MSELSDKLEREVLPLVARPGRYTGGERNLPSKDPAEVRLRFLLAFPDVYEIGMSHLGIRMLGDILNRRPDVSAERVFAPWVDMEERMREAGVPLFSLESRTPAAEFDVIGFTLQYELHYTNILAMLDLAGVPMRAGERAEAGARGAEFPLVIGGGPCAFNPEPVAEFFDALVIGDGESAVLDIADLVVRAKEEGATRGELLERAASLEGVYVPLLNPGGSGAPSVRRRAERSLSYEGHPCVPVVPVMETTHDRLSVEIMRGCTRGCRFCQPGMVTRPVRQRSPEDIVKLVDEGLASSGYDEVSLVSLSTSDHDGLPEVIAALNDRLFDRRVSISLPSLRVDRFGLELADSISRVRRAGLTFAPEAGTQRLRDVINKNETEESILETVDVAFASGWNRIKLYFMIGLPTETEEDLQGIVDLVSKVRSVARAHKKGARINVSISPFVPRAHTPFQWERQDLPSETRDKERFLREGLRRFKGIKLATRDPEVSFLEGVMARGDRALGPAVESAFRAGARFDGWTETFDFGRWRAAFAERSMVPEDYLAERPLDGPLPWDHIDAGPTHEFLLSERSKALAGEVTPDCREDGCFDCGACAPPGEARAAEGREMPARGAALTTAGDTGATFGRRDRKVRRGENGGERWRVRYAKGPEMRFVSHLDIVRSVLRAISMSGLPVVFTQGFNPHPKMSFGPPLPVGSTGDAEFFDLELTRQATGSEVERRLSEHMPEGLRVLSVASVSSKRSVSAMAEGAEYVVSGLRGLSGLSDSEVASRVDELRRTPEANVRKGERVKTIRPQDQILELEVLAGPDAEGRGGTPGAPGPAGAGAGDRSLRVVLSLGNEGAMRPVDVVRLLTEGSGEPPELARVHRTALLRRSATTGGLEPIR